MKVLVLATAAVEGGALSVLTNLYNDVISSKTNNTWYFAVSVNTLKNSDNVNILHYPNAKKSRRGRVYFDKITVERLVDDYDIDVVVSLQNTISRSKKVSQILYMHQALPFVDRKYSIKENKKFWFYQNIMKHVIMKSIKQSDQVIVQSNWIKDAIVNNMSIDNSKIKVSYPVINVSNIVQNNGEFTNKFFYPAGPFSYKNHQMILESLIDVEDDYTLDLTLNSDDIYTHSLIEFSKKHKLHVNFIGSIPSSDVFDYYSKSILIFASEIETFGLPLLEAKLSSSLILALNTPFSKEILHNYPNVYFFNTTKELEHLIKNILAKKVCPSKISSSQSMTNRSLYDDIEKFIEDIE